MDAAELGLPEFGQLRVRKSDKSDLRWSSPRMTVERLVQNQLECVQAPSLSARSSKLLAAISTATLGAVSPVPGPRSPGRPTWAVRSPFDAAAARSLLCAAVIMHSLGLM